ncbi:FAD-dependent oxidoreductase [Endozoicomonas sp. Mp262]|uniref:NAD(P)/FAD-dependent oxidoreductase n=1 Tax=Endozoicomonas sp. Mp262 TaxID=2919499 RepID=UPI0021D89DD4
MQSQPLEIAVIGSGISGLSCAWLLSTRHRVTLFEKDHRFGGHSHTVKVKGRHDDISVDTGFIVFNERTYPNLTRFFQHLNVKTRATDMSFGVSLEGGKTEYSGTDLNGLFGHRKNLVSPGFWKMLLDVRRFYRDSRRWLEEMNESVTLGQLLAENSFSQRFINEHIIPMGAAIWSTPAEQMLDYPALAFLRFCQNHGLLQLSNRPQWRTVVGGSGVYVEKIIESLGSQALCNRCISKVKRYDDGVVVFDRQGDEWAFDHVVMATHADITLELLDEPDEQEQSILKAFPYQRNKAVLHSDTRLMPCSNRVWSSWNYMGGNKDQGPSVTYWMNHLQHIDDIPLFVSLNPLVEPEQNKIHGCYLYDHPVFTRHAIAAQQKIWELQGRRRTWYCGAYMGHGFHEDGLQAGLATAEKLGEVKRPWRIANESYRLALPARGWDTGMTL